MKKRILLIFAVLTLAITTMSGCTKEENTEKLVKEESYVPVEIESVSTNSLYIESTFSGKVFADKEIMVMPKMVGKVEKVNVSVGDSVNKNAVLFTLEKEDVQKQVNQAKTAYESTKANFELNKEKIENGKVTFERTKKLYEEGAVSKAQYEQAQLAASDKSLESATKGLEQAKLAYDQAKDTLKNLNVKSPISGTVAGINVEVGEFATTAQPSMTIVDASRIYVQISVTEDIVNNIYKGQEVKLNISSVKEENFIGKVDSVSPTADARTQLFPVNIYIDNNEGLIKPGMFSEVRIKTDIREDVIAIKSEAVIERDEKFYVYVTEDDKAIEKEVTVGLDAGVYIEIINGINLEEKVIVKGQTYVTDRSKVKIVRGE